MPGALAFGVLLAAAAWGGGSLVGAGLDRLDRGRAFPDDRPRPSGWVAAALGAWVLGLATLVLSAARALRPAPLLGLLVALALAGVALAAPRWWRAWQDRRSRTIRDPAPRPGPGGLTALLAVLLGLLALATLVRALAPAVDWDVIAYHFPIARRYLQQESLLGDLPTIRMARWPLGLDALFVFGEAAERAAGAPAGPGLVGWLLAVLGAGAAATLGRQAGGRPGAWLAAALFAGAPAVGWLPIGYVDAGLAGLAGLALAALLDHLGHGRRRELVVAGLLAGAAAAAKYTGLAVPLAGAVILLGLTRCWRRTAVFALAALLAGGPWYLRTWSLGGSPLGPYAHGLLGGRDWSPEAAARLSAFERGHGYLGGQDPRARAADLLLFPFEATFRPRAPDEAGLGPCFLALLPLGVAGCRRSRWGLGVLLYLAVGLGAWAAATWQVRFLIPLLPAAAAAIAAGAARVPWPQTAWLARALAALSAVLTALGAIHLAAPRLAVLAGRESREAFVARAVDHHPAVAFVNRSLRPGRLLLFRELRGYYLDVPYLWGDPLNQAVIDYSRLAGSEDLAERLCSLGIDAVLINDRHYVNPAYYLPGERAMMEAVVERHGALAWSGAGVRVYRLFQNGPSLPAQLTPETR